LDERGENFMRDVLELSVVICVADDVRIKSALDSIDCYCEAVVVLNGASQEVRNILKNYDSSNKFILSLYEIPERNLSKARNIGTQNAMYNKVVFIDSDCVITSGSLSKFYKMLEKYFLVDGKVFFKKDTFQSSIISVTRELGLPGCALCPSMGIDKEIKPLIDNHFFDNDIQWIEDSELNIRAKKSNIKVGVISSVTCIHDNLTFKQDLKSAYRYGYGVRIAARKGLHKNRPTANWNLIPIIFKKNVISALYYVIWNVVYCVGYYYHRKI
jgi:glycosyltransferase involved in cell wall biosynthesis